MMGFDFVQTLLVLSNPAAVSLSEVAEKISRV
jgi:hypothetical protein